MAYTSINGLLNFNCLTMTSLRNYAKEYHLDIPENAMHSEVADIVSKHFMSLPIDENEVMVNFVSRLEEIRKSRQNGTEGSNSDRRKIRRPKKVDCKEMLTCSMVKMLIMVCPVQVKM
ncbi:hypothetical protein WA171_003475 [Blastocystis sp. BT1]